MKWAIWVHTWLTLPLYYRKVDGRSIGGCLMTVFICFIYILYCTHSKLSCPGKYVCNPVYPFSNSRAFAMEKWIYFKRILCQKWNQTRTWTYFVQPSVLKTAGLSFPRSWKSSTCLLIAIPICYKDPNSFIATSMSYYQKHIRSHFVTVLG